MSVSRLATSLVFLLAVVVLTAPAFALDFVLRSDFLDEGTLRLGTNQDVVFDVVIDNDRQDFDSSIQAFQLAISHVGTDVEFRDVSWEGTALDTSNLRNGQGPSFFLAQEVDDGTGDGVTLGVVFDQDTNSGFLLGPGSHVVAKLRYRGLASSPGNPSPLGFAASLGDPAIVNKVNTFGGDILEPDLENPVSITVSGDVLYSIRFGGPNRYQATNGDLITLPIRVHNNPLDVTGFSFGVAYDSGLLSREGDVTAGPGLDSILDGQALGDFGFFAFNEVVDSGGGLFGFTVAMVFSDAGSQASGDPLKILPASEDGHHVLDVRFRVTSPSSSLSTVEIVDDLGDPAVDILMDIHGVAQEPEVNGAPALTAVTVQVGDNPGSPFLRSDVDQDSRVNLTDALNIIKFQFTPDDVPPIVRDTGANCFGAFDVNADNVVGVGDALNLLTFLFSTGARPAAPYPACGTPAIEPDPDKVCLIFSCP
jgi:hypothetical protein